MAASAFAVIAGYALGSVPVAYLAGRLRGGVDIRLYGSGNVGASNVWQSVSKALVVPVGLAQIGQGAGAVLVARALDGGDGVQVAAGLAAIVAHNWNPWLGLKGGRGVGLAMGFLIVLAPTDAFLAFVIVALAGVVLRAIPQGIALGLVAAPIAGAVADRPPAIVAGAGAIVVLVLLKRLLANGAPAPEDRSGRVWLNRLVYDRDIRDREEWVRRGLETREQPH